MNWFNEPPNWNVPSPNSLTVTTAAKTDFWRKTEDNGIRDSGHFYFTPITGDFSLSVKISGQYKDLYDQAGIMIRENETTWLKSGIEYLKGVQQASAVVTRDYSDWSVVPLVPAPVALWLRVKRHNHTFEIQYSADGQTFNLMRQAFLTHAEKVDVGMMCASPIGDGFSVRFEEFQIESN